MTTAAPDSALRVKLVNQQRRDDPLTYWKFAVPRLREAFSLFSTDGLDELLARACNKGTKTETVAAFVVACLQKRQSLDGVPLPQWTGPVEAAQLCLDYPQQLLSIQPAYLRVLGAWPYHARYHGEILSSLRVKPVNGSDDESTWSVVHFLSQKNTNTGTGVRGDIIAFDEPPKMEILRELRKAAHANRRSVTIIGATPTLRKQWAPLKADYGDCPRRTLRRVDQERAEVRWSLDEVADFVLTPRDKEKLRRKYATDPLKDAREHGDYIDTSGMCPFHVPTLELMLKECVEPQIQKVIARHEVTENGTRADKLTTIPLQVWEFPKFGREYYVCIDPASGVEGGHPLGLHVTEFGSGNLVARYLGHDSPYVIGVLAAVVARQYNNALVQPEINDGWATGVFDALRDAKYGRIGKEPVELRPGEWHDELGFRTTGVTRPGMIAAVQKWVTAWGAGIKYAKCPSREVIENLMDVILDENDKPVVIAGLHHGEDMVIRGQSIKKTVNRAGLEIPEAHPAMRTPEQELMALVRGEPDRGNARPPDTGRLLHVPRPRV